MSWLVYAGLGLLSFLALAGGGSKEAAPTPKAKADEDKKKADDLKKEAEDKAKKAEESKDAKDAEEALKAALAARKAAFDAGFSKGVADKSSGFEFDGNYGNSLSGELKAAAKEGYSSGYSSVSGPETTPVEVAPSYDAKKAAFDSGFSAGVSDKTYGLPFNGSYGESLSWDLKAAAKEGYSAGYSSVAGP